MYTYTLPSKKNQHLDLTKQIGTILPLDDYYMDDFYVPKEWGQLTTWIYRMTSLFHQWIFPPDGTGIFQDDNTRISSGIKLGKSGSGSMRHHLHTWIGHHRVQSQTLTPLRIFGMCWRRLCAAVTSSIQDLAEKCMQLWTGINVVTLQKLIEIMPQRMRAVITAKSGPK